MQRPHQRGQSHGAFHTHRSHEKMVRGKRSAQVSTKSKSGTLHKKDHGIIQDLAPTQRRLYILSDICLRHQQVRQWAAFSCLSGSSSSTGL
jgi:hypothetical protein